MHKRDFLFRNQLLCEQRDDAGVAFWCLLNSNAELLNRAIVCTLCSRSVIQHVCIIWVAIFFASDNTQKKEDFECFLKTLAFPPPSVVQKLLNPDVTFYRYCVRDHPQSRGVGGKKGFPLKINVLYFYFVYQRKWHRKYADK